MDAAVYIHPLGSLGERILKRRLEVGDDVADGLDPDGDLGDEREILRMGIECTEERRTRIPSAVTPAEAISSTVSCECVVDAGWITSVFASPGFIH
jgi:hypothetical protein